MVPEVAWEKKELSVYWQTSSFEFFRTIIENFIKQEFHSKTNIRYTGWGWCSAEEPADIRIRFVDNVKISGMVNFGAMGYSNLGRGFYDTTWLPHDRLPL